MNDFMAVGSNELGDRLGDTIVCKICGESHPIEQSEPSRVIHSDGTIETGPPGLLQFYKCGETAYIAGINGLALK